MFYGIDNEDCVQLSHTIYFWFEQAAVETTSGVFVNTVLQPWSAAEPSFLKLQCFSRSPTRILVPLKGPPSGRTGPNLSRVSMSVSSSFRGFLHVDRLQDDAIKAAGRESDEQ